MDQEYFYTFLKPVEINYSGKRYYVHGYSEMGGEIISLSATTDLNTPWTKADCYFDKDFIKELAAIFPPAPVKTKRKRKTK